MIIKINSSKLLTILFSITLFFLLTHLVISFIYPDVDSQAVKTFNNDEVDLKFKKALYSFAIKDEWITKIKDKSSIASYRINVPSDLPITQILAELNKQFYGSKLAVNSKEIRMHGRTLMQIVSDDEIKLKADFRYNSEIQRTVSKSSLFVFGRENKEAEYDSLMLYTSPYISALLVPSKSNSSYSKWLRENGFDYAIWINDNINDIEFRLKEDFSETRLKLIIQNLVVSFPNALFYVFDKKSAIYSSPNYSFFKKEFDKRKIAFFTSDSLEFINMNQSDASSRLSYIVKNQKSEIAARIAISLDAYQFLGDELNQLMRIGYKFVKYSN